MDLKHIAETPPWEWPPDAGKTFLAVLGNRRASEEDRLIAAQHAGDLVVVNDALCDALIRVVSSADETEELRAAAAIAFGPSLELADTEGFDGDDVDSGVPITEKAFHRIQGALRKPYSDESVPKLVRRRILEASVRAPEGWHRDAIREAYSSGDRDWMLTAVFAMQYIRGFDDQIVEALNSSDDDTHYAAVVAAGSWSIDEAWQHVLSLVNDPATPKPLRLAAIEALGSIRPAEARKILIDLQDSDDEEIAEAAEEALLMAGPEEFEEADDENPFF